jgi:hypothetical protein
MDRDVATPAGVRVNSIVLAFTLVAGMVVFLRMFTRFSVTKRAGFEDACIGFAMVSRSGCILVLSYLHSIGLFYRPCCHDFRPSDAWPGKT